MSFDKTYKQQVNEGVKKVPSKKQPTFIFNHKYAKRLMLEHDTNVNQIFKFIGMSQPQLNRLMNGRSVNPPKSDVLLNLANFFNVHPNDLLTQSVSVEDAIVSKAVEKSQEKVIRLSFENDEEIKITPDTAITIAKNAGKMFDKIRTVISNERLDSDSKVEMISLLLDD